MRESVGYARDLMGGNGILLEHNVGRFVADAEAIYSFEGTREMNTLIVGRAITGITSMSAFASSGSACDVHQVVGGGQKRVA
jgi:alkylation response protein AidB-like acyl-CoA dehydrogenase